MVCLQTHIISNTRRTTRYVHISTLIIISTTENHVIPIYIRIDIRIDTTFCRRNDLIRITWCNCCRTTRLLRLVIGAHECRSISKLRCIHRLEIRGLDRHVDRCFCIFLPMFGCNKHDAIRTTVTIDCRCRSILQNRKTFDTFCRNTVQVPRRYFHTIQQNQWSCHTTKRIDATDIERRSRTWLTTTVRRNNTSQFTRQ